MDRLPAGGPVKDDELEVIRDAGIIVENNRISTTGRFEKLRKQENKIEVEELEHGKTILPGLVDAHTHLCHAGSRAEEYGLRIAGENYEKILAAGGGIYHSVNSTRAASKDDLKSGLIMRAMRHFSEGVTTIEVKSGYGLNRDDELKMLRSIKEGNDEIPADLVATCLAAHVVPHEFGDETRYLDFLLKELLPAIKKENLCSRVDIFIERNAFSPHAAEKYLTEVKKLGFGVTIHADQFSTGGSGVAVKVKAMSADHLEASGGHEIRQLAESDVATTVLPGASLGLGLRFARARDMLDHGCRLVIATDWNPGTAPMGDLLMQASVLSAFEKLTSAETFAGITFRAAAALGIADIGIIAKTKKADFIAFDCPDFREILYHQGKLKPSLVWKNGKKFESKLF